MIRGGPELANGGLPWPKGPQALIVKAAIGPQDQVEASFRAWLEQVDIDAHLDGGTFRLLPLVYERLRAVGFTDPLMGRMKGVYRRAWAENSALFNDVASTIGGLEASGVRTLLLKGAPLAFSYYANHATRPMSDLDVVIPSGQRERALEVLKNLGWTSVDWVPADELADQHGLGFRNAAGREIDLHWHCLRETPSSAADAWFWADAQPFKFAGVATRQPSPTVMLLHLVLHGVRSNVEPPIRWVVDTATVVRTRGDEIDWASLVAYAKSQKLTHRLSLGLDFLAREYDVPIPAEVLRDLKARRASLIERIENLGYLGPAEFQYRPRIFPLVDYWRYLRTQSPWAFVTGFPAYLRRRWRLRSLKQAPLEILATLRRRYARTSAESRT